MSLVVSFHGADHRCGTTMAAQCVAERIAELYPGLKLLLLHMEGRRGTEYSSMVNESMEGIKPYLTEKLLNPEELLGKARWRDNLYAVTGAGETGSIFSYHPDMSQYFINTMMSKVDLVLCDTGSEIEHGLCLGALLSSDRIYQVLAQRESAVACHEYKKPFYEKLCIKSFAYVVSDYDKSNPYTMAYLAERLGLEKEVFRRLRHSDYGLQAEIDGKSLVSYPDRGLRKDVDVIAEEIAAAVTS